MSGEAAGKHIDEMFQTLSTNGSAAAAGQEHSSSASSDELIRHNHHQLAGDHQPLLLPSRSSEEEEQEVNENSCANNGVNNNNNNNSSSEAAAAATEQPQMDSSTTAFEEEDDDTAGAQLQERFPPLTGEGEGGGDMSELMINLNQDLNLGEEISTADAAAEADDSHHQLHNINGAPSPTLFGFNLSSLTPSNSDIINRGGAGVEVDHVHAQQQQQVPAVLSHDYNYDHGQQHQPPSTNFFTGHDHHVPNNNVSFGNNNNNGVFMSHFNVNARPPPSWSQEMPSFAQSMLPTHELYGASPAPPQFHQLLPPPQHYQMQMTWPETMIQQPSHDAHHHQQYSPVHGLQRIPTHRAPAPPASASASRRRPPYMPNSLYDPNFQLMGLPADPFLRLMVSNPNFANRRRRN